jgi:acylphosphatase
MRNLKDTNIKVASYITNKPVEELKAEAKAKAESKTEAKVKVEATSIPKEDSTNEDLSEKQS